MGIAAQCLHGAKVCLLPQPGNDYRPLALRHAPLAIVSGLLVMAKVLSISLIGLMPMPAELATITTARIVQLTNQERADAGLPELAVNAALSKAAADKARDMLEHDYFAHISPTGVTPWFWINNVGYSYRLAGENLAIDFIEAEDVVAAWMASPSHRENILQGAFRETGVGVLTGEFEGGTSTVVVHLFGQAAGSAAAAPAAAAAAPAAPSTPEPAVLADTTPPAVPTLQLVSHDIVGTEAFIRVAGEAHSTVTILVNDRVHRQITLTSGGGEATLQLADFPDGELVFTAFGQDAAGNQSAPSAPQQVVKDTTGPAVDPAAVTWLISPATDAPQALLLFDSPDVAGLAIETEAGPAVTTRGDVLPLAEAPIRLVAYDARGNGNVVYDAALWPSFYAEADTSYLTPPARLGGGVRTLTIAAAVAIGLLLSLAVIIRLSIQRPGMIMHAVLVMALAIGLLTV